LIYELTGPTDNELKEVWDKMAQWKGILLEMMKSQDNSLPGFKYKVLVKKSDDVPPSYVKILRIPMSWVKPRPDIRYIDINNAGWKAERINGKINIIKYGDTDE
jgi:hypothetical protein